MKNTVETSRPEYDQNIELWRMVEDACTGEHAIKLRGEWYLPRPNPGDYSVEANERYKQYLTRATYYNATGRTLSSLVGMAFQKWPEITLPATLDYLVDNADGSGVSLVQSAQMTLAAVLKTGRAGLLVDFPVVENTAETSVSDMRSGNAVATINLYPAHSIINWRMERQGGIQVLTLVVMRETVNEYDDFGSETKITYRVLRLQDGVYTQEVWKQGDGEAYTMDTTSTPLNAKGKPWSKIPFAFVGAVRNAPDLETYADTMGAASGLMVSPLYNIAALNIAHYRNSADYEDSCFLVGQPQPYMTGLDPEWRDELVKQGVVLGSRSVLPLPVGGTFGMAQAQPNTMVRQAMLDKEEQMRALGAKLIQPNTGRSKTATQSNTDATNDQSVLALVCDNISLAYTAALGYAAEFMGGDGEECSLAIDTDFAINPLDAPSITAAIQAWQAKAVPETDMWAMLRKMGVIDPQKTDDEIREEIEAQGPSLGSLTVPPPKPVSAAAINQGEP